MVVGGHRGSGWSRAALGLTTVLTLALAGCGPGSGREPVDPGTATTSPVATPTDAPTSAPSIEPDSSGSPAPTPTVSPTPTPTSSPSTTPTPADDPLRPGDAGPAIVAVQQELAGLGYWLGAADGVFGDATTHAVVALQKAAGIGRDGIVGPQTRRALDEGVQPTPRSADGVVLEVDRDLQLVLLAEDGALVRTFDTSTGRAGLTTPAGWFAITRVYDGYRTAPLGVLYRPLYFNGGIAIHGYPSVPPYPASHGCVRVTNAVADWLWADGRVGVGTTVWVR